MKPIQRMGAPHSANNRQRPLERVGLVGELELDRLADLAALEGRRNHDLARARAVPAVELAEIHVDVGHHENRLWPAGHVDEPRDRAADALRHGAMLPFRRPRGNIARRWTATTSTRVCARWSRAARPKSTPTRKAGPHTGSRPRARQRPSD